MGKRIALATTVELPVADADEDFLLPELPEATVAAWDDPSVDWASFGVVVIRSTWNYIHHLDRFLEWAQHVTGVSRLMNPVETIRWNTDKRYLNELVSKGIPTVPTEFVVPGDDTNQHSVDLSSHVVVKPAIGAGSEGAKLFKDNPTAARDHLDSLLNAGRVAMVQPYLKQVDEFGETALIYVGGEFSHAARKAAILSRDMSWSTGLYADEKVVATQATPEERALADRIVADLPGLAYARVDLLPTPNGPVVLELELTEPSLFLGLDPEAPRRAAQAFRALL